MSYFDNENGYYNENPQNYYGQQQQSQDPNLQNFGQEQSFAQFDYSQQAGYRDQQYYTQPPAYSPADPYAGSQYSSADQYGGAQYGTSDQYGGAQYSSGYNYGGSEPFNSPYGGSNPYGGEILSPDPSQMSPTADGFEEEPPLLEELGINFDHIFKKTLSVLNPLQPPGPEIMQDTDLAGPLVFCLAFGGTLLLSGKLHFGYIYGIGLVGCVAMYFLLNMMSLTGVSVTCITSVLGYCLLPMVILSFSAVFLSLKGLIGVILTAIIVLWCSLSASNLFVTALAMQGQQLIVAYPCALVYGVFALLTVF